MERFADHFPKAPKDCKVPAQTFFSCFSNSSIKLSSDDKDAGARGLEKCLKEKKAYDTCMFGWEKKYPPNRFRVSFQRSILCSKLIIIVSGSR